MEELIVLEPSHKQTILDFENDLRSQSGSLEELMLTWDARWRPEALDHYLALGWSFAVLDDGILKSYILSQPFVFFRGLTQTLWVEWIGAGSEENAHRVLDVAYRWARDKHFQSIVLENTQSFSAYAKSSSFPFENKEGFLILKTSKMK